MMNIMDCNSGVAFPTKLEGAVADGHRMSNQEVFFYCETRFDDLNHQYFGGKLQKHEFKDATGEKGFVAAYTYGNHGKMHYSLNMDMMPRYPKLIDVILLHEMCHAAVFEIEYGGSWKKAQTKRMLDLTQGHGADWKNYMKKVGLTPPSLYTFWNTSAIEELAHSCRTVKECMEKAYRMAHEHSFKDADTEMNRDDLEQEHETKVRELAMKDFQTAVTTLKSVAPSKEEKKVYAEMLQVNFKLLMKKYRQAIADVINPDDDMIDDYDWVSPKQKQETVDALTRFWKAANYGFGNSDMYPGFQIRWDAQHPGFFQHRQ